MNVIYCNSNYLCHHGVKGMKWGVRRYQNYDGTRIGSAKRQKASKNVGIMRSANLSSKRPDYYRNEYKSAGIDKDDVNRAVKELQAIRESESKDEYNRRERKALENHYGFNKGVSKEEFLNRELEDHKQYLISEIEERQKYADNPDPNNKFFTKFNAKCLREDKAELKTLNTEKGAKEYKDLWGKYYDESKRDYDRMKISDHTARDEVIKRGREETKPLLDDLKTKKYGSDEWFEAREKYYKASESYTRDYANAVLKDLGKQEVSDISREYMENGKEFSAPLLGTDSYVYSDYRDIADPVRNTRDYGLESAYKDWARRTRR